MARAQTTEDSRGQRSHAAAVVLCNLIKGPTRHAQALFAVPGVPKHLYGTDGTLHHWATRQPYQAAAISKRCVPPSLRQRMHFPGTARSHSLASRPRTHRNLMGASRPRSPAIGAYSALSSPSSSASFHDPTSSASSDADDVGTG
eukprot:CAMPEP_0174852894 /NCGR_PEP_ID=MMETSP1114-20130205/27236_1 /TAXON_ID=312471 /ORGANISM="Neobodo designis, Strain CCAP 1951/1" /LENGTH=144 /DNA_ID=CAMNT_0016087513 /DNA_START=56 /DNA_END=491 /DNA_ORIENTATION=-